MGGRSEAGADLTGGVLPSDLECAEDGDDDIAEGRGGRDLVLGLIHLLRDVVVADGGGRPEEDHDAHGDGRGNPGGAQRADLDPLGAQSAAEGLVAVDAGGT